MAELQSALKQEAQSKTMVYQWYQEFKSGRDNFSDEYRSDRPNTAVTPENVEAVRQLIKEDRNISI